MVTLKTCPKAPEGAFIVNSSMSAELFNTDLKLPALRESLTLNSASMVFPLFTKQGKVLAWGTGTLSFNLPVFFAS
jgi:hypothetical protein